MKARWTTRLAASIWLSLPLACAPSLIVAHMEPIQDEQPRSVVTTPRPKVSVSAKLLFGSSYRPESCEENERLQKVFVEEVTSSRRFDVVSDAGPFDIQLDACFHEADDVANVEGPLMIAGLTAGLIPTWYSRELVLEVTARRDGRADQHYVETDSYTAINWLLLTPFAFYWSSPRVFLQVAREQLGRVLVALPD